MRFPPLLSKSHFWKIAGINLMVGNLILWIFFAWIDKIGDTGIWLAFLSFSLAALFVIRLALPFCSGSSESTNTIIGFIASYVVYLLAIPTLIFLVGLSDIGNILKDLDRLLA
jgi:uncharacterized membrane protein